MKLLLFNKLNTTLVCLYDNDFENFNHRRVKVNIFNLRMTPIGSHFFTHFYASATFILGKECSALDILD